jgi:scyllo-inositol 2-dehydrogenase (NADP+)
MIKTAIVGYGKSAQIFHLPFLLNNSNYQITAFCSSQIQSLTEKFPRARIYSTVEDLAGDTDIDLVVICSPSFLHYSQAKILLHGGKNLVIEKPFCLKSTQAEELIKLAEQQNLKLCVFQNRRWDSGFLTLKKLIADDTLGEINFYEVHIDRWKPHVQKRWREEPIEGAGIVFDLGAHLIDQVISVMGEPETISVDKLAQRPGALVEDYFHLVFQYPLKRAIIHSSSLAQTSPFYILAHGSKASFLHLTMDPQEALLNQGLAPGLPGWTGTVPGSSFLFSNKNGSLIKTEIDSVPGSYGEFYDLMFKSLSQGAPVPVCPREVLKSIKILEAL